MKKYILIFWLILFLFSGNLWSQTQIPNESFEDWTTIGNYSNPTGWDSPNEELMSIPFVGTQVVTKSSDHHGTGSFSARLESKHLSFPPLDVPGFMITANLTVNITSATYSITGGVPVTDMPTHLQGYYKFSPKGGDSCIIGIGLFKTNGGVMDSIGHAEFSTKDTVPDWTYFSKWIEYLQPTNPDTMQVYAFSSAQEVPTAGTVLYVDDLFLDYTVGTPEYDLSKNVHIYNDRETKRLIIFFDTDLRNDISVRLFDMIGRQVTTLSKTTGNAQREVIPYENLKKGIYILEILHHRDRLTKKYFLGN